MNGLQKLQSIGFEFSEDATFSAKDDSIAVSRVKVGGTLSINDVSPQAIVRATAASTGGQVAVAGVNDRIEAGDAAQVVNVLIGNPLSDADAADLADIAIGEARRESTREFVRLQAEAQNEKRLARESEAADRAAAKELAASHVGEDSVKV